MVRPRLLVVLLGSVLGCTFDASGVGGPSSGTGPAADTSGAATTGAPTPTSTTDPTLESSSDDGARTTSSADASGASAAHTTSPSSTSSDGSSTTGASLPCDDLLWVAGSAAAVGTDGPLAARLEEAGFVLTFADDDLVQPADAAGRCAVLVSGTVDDAVLGGRLRQVVEPVILWKPEIFDDMGVALVGAHGVAEGLNQVLIIDASHPLAAGQRGVVDIYAGTGRIGWGTAVHAHIVADRADLLGLASLYAYSMGDLLADEMPAAGPRIVLPITDAPDAVLQPVGLDLFENAVRWATGP